MRRMIGRQVRRPAAGRAPPGSAGIPGRPRAAGRRRAGSSAAPTSTICTGFCTSSALFRKVASGKKLRASSPEKAATIASARRDRQSSPVRMREPGQHPDQRAVAGRDRGVGGGLDAGDQRRRCRWRQRNSRPPPRPSNAGRARRSSRVPGQEHRRRRSPRAAPARRGTDWRNRRRSPDGAPARRASYGSSRPSRRSCRGGQSRTRVRASAIQSGRSNTSPAFGQRRDHQPVPVGEHLVVPARPHPRCARPATAARGTAPARARSRRRRAPA